MNKNTANLALLCSSITVTGSLFTGNASAQEPEPVQKLQLEEVVVTAQKREESLTEAPLTVNLVGADAMRDAAIFQADELNKLTAGVEIRVVHQESAG